MSPHSEGVVFPGNGAAESALIGDGFSNRVDNDDAAAPLAFCASSVPSESSAATSHYANGHATNDARTASPLRGHVDGVNGRPPHNDAAQSSPYLLPAPLDVEYDLICVGFGPASLSIAVAMHDALASGRKLLANGSSPKLLFIEKQDQFAWHSGMLLPGAKMQISFIKDLATLRNPRSEFTFLNYLHRHNRLVDFTNLSTFLPARAEYEEYLRWCSSFFTRLVQFGQQVLSVSPNGASNSPVRSFSVRSQDTATGKSYTYRGRHVLIATGGQPSLPQSFPLKNPRVIHSSQYANVIHKIIPKASTPCRVVVVGAGQSAAEIFNNVASRYPNSKTHLVMRQEFLRPSDDSPFVNCVFNPEYIDSMFPKSAKYRNNLLSEARATNYGVVRLELIEALYERMYDQRREIGADETKWPHRIMGGKQIISTESHGDVMQLRLRNIYEDGLDGFVDASDDEIIEADLVIAATGYRRDLHVGMLKDAWNLLPKASPGAFEFGKGISGWNVDTKQGERKIAVGRDYKVKFAPGAVAEDAGIWLQGCCEGTHGLSDSLLSVLATRSGEMVDNIFGNE
ncbi:hypothetical protein E4U42_002112 [Claviceps africana]|uniref:L-ornithine N(5)-monooxygenase [NAD(P)H] n=1 Tax=Claviceps africana TaxID=83212 RepID=A0A8K0J8M5_9HYPO|nr:hypothetical protein E4U42_002112 [Claviceps africana]